MMISSNDAPRLENALHRALHGCRVNKVNPRKEYFRVDLDRIVSLVNANHGEVEYVASPEALEYFQSSTMSDEDAEYIDRVFDENDDEVLEEVE